MAEVKWIKLYTNMFGNRKIKQIETLPNGDSILVIWLKLLTLAGNVNDCGMVYFTKDIPYTDQMLSVEFGKPLSTIQLALDVFVKFNMVEIADNFLSISNWEKYQNVEGMEKIREQTRQRVANHRAKQKALGCNVTCNVTETLGNAIDIDKDIKNKKKNNKTSSWGDVSKTLLERLEAFEEMRKRIKKPLTDDAKKLILIKLDKYADTEEEKIEILNNSILNSWQGIYELKNKPKYIESGERYEMDF